MKVETQMTYPSWREPEGEGGLSTSSRAEYNAFATYFSYNGGW